jgi:ABC-type transport system, involved in lipoprotein release, permease component
MRIVDLALRNILRHPRRSAAIVALVSCGAALLVVGNAIISEADAGIRSSFIDSFTADFAIGAASEESFSLFGNEVPLVGEYAVAPPILDTAAVLRHLSAIPQVASCAAIVAGSAAADFQGWQSPVSYFGTDDAARYFGTFPALRLLSGKLFSGDERGILLNDAQYRAIQEKTGAKLRLGDPIGISIFNDSGFTLRSLPFRGVFKYPRSSTTADRTCIIDGATARELNGYDRLASSPVVADTAEPLAVDGSVDALFGGSDEGVVHAEGALDLRSVEAGLRGSSSLKVDRDRSSCNFILLRLADDASAGAARKAIAKALADEGLDIQILDWRQAAGSQAQTVFLLRLIFNIGLAILSIAAIIIIMNALVISVLERSGEIGMMRAIGASRAYVSLLYMIESLSITGFGALVGTGLGSLCIVFLGSSGIALRNPLFVTLFGSTMLRPSLSLSSVGGYLLASFCIGAIAWIYPVVMVLRTEPALAMARAHE